MVSIFIVIVLFRIPIPSYTLLKCYLFLSFTCTTITVHDQILLGSAHANYCVLLGLASWLEWMIGEGLHEDSNYLFCYESSNDPIWIKKTASKMMKDVLQDDLFHLVIEDDDNEDKKVGSHSIRKFGKTKSRRSGCSKDNIDYHFCWK